MAITVNFWQFSKRENSTAIPGGSPAASFSCSLKSDSGVLSPILEIGLPMNANPIPAAFNYAQIPAYSRYYRVTDWQWSGGVWLCSLEVDTLASWRSYIGSSSHYVLRAAADYDPALVDDFYPPKATRPEFITSTGTFPFKHFGDDGSPNFDCGSFVVGIAGRYAEAGPINYYVLSVPFMRALIGYMLPAVPESWLSSFSGMADSIYRAIYGPFDYIKSCLWFPFSPADILGTPLPYTEYLIFGNYAAEPAAAGDPSASGWLLPDNNTRWPLFRITLSMPAGWQSMDAKYKSPPYGNLYLVLNPFGVIELNPLDFSNANSVLLELWPDFISGDCLLKIYKNTNEGPFFVSQSTAKLSVNMPLSAAASNVTGILGNGASAIGSAIMAVSAESAAAAAISGVAAGASASAAAAAAVPTLSASIGSVAGGPRAMDGTALLIFSSINFASEDPADHGRPLCQTRTLSTLPGYIKCADGHISIPAYSEEIDSINQYLQGGFFYE